VPPILAASVLPFA